MNNKISESIFDGKRVVVPMADVSHIEKKFINEKDINYPCNEGRKVGDISGIIIVTKHTTYNADQDEYNNAIWLTNEEADAFLKAWCVYRHELEKESLVEAHN